MMQNRGSLHIHCAALSVTCKIKSHIDFHKTSIESPAALICRAGYLSLSAASGNQRISTLDNILLALKLMQIAY